MRPLIDSSGAWAKEARMMASDRAQASGLPQRRDEYWKYTRPDAFVQADVTLHASQRSSLGLFDQRATISVAFEDGQIQAAPLPSAAHCTLESLSAAADLDLHWARDIYGTFGGGRTETGSTESGGCEHSCCAGWVAGQCNGCRRGPHSYPRQPPPAKAIPQSIM
jgi:hypothetical protein